VGIVLGIKYIIHCSYSILKYNSLISIFVTLHCQNCPWN